MRKLFIPVIALINRLKYPQKFSLIGRAVYIAHRYFDVFPAYRNRKRN